jgi:hypothetical protein
LLNPEPKPTVISGIQQESNEKEHVKHFSGSRAGARGCIPDFGNTSFVIQSIPYMKAKTADQLFAYLVSAIIGLMMFALASPAVH